MEKSGSEIEIHAPGSGVNWYAASGVNGVGDEVTLNFFADSEPEIAPLAHVANIVHNLSLQYKAAHVGTRADYYRLFK